MRNLPNLADPCLENPNRCVYADSIVTCGMNYIFPCMVVVEMLRDHR